jgi:hypothetical protein
MPADIAKIDIPRPRRILIMCFGAIGDETGDMSAEQVAGTLTDL